MKDSLSNASKSFYRISRECCNLTLENASELMDCISPSRLHKIESGKSYPHPDEILRISQCYNDPELVLHYCTEFCEIGKANFPRVRLNSTLSDILLKLLRNIEALRIQTPVMLQFEIEDIDNNLEIMDRIEFKNFRETLLALSSATLELNMWIEKNHTKLSLIPIKKVCFRKKGQDSTEVAEAYGNVGNSQSYPSFPQHYGLCLQY